MNSFKFWWTCKKVGFLLWVDGIKRKIKGQPARQSCYNCRHVGNQEYCDRQGLDYGERTCSGWEHVE